MDKPCRHCEKSVEALRGAFEQECFGTCDIYDQWNDAAKKSLHEFMRKIMERRVVFPETGKKE